MSKKKKKTHPIYEATHSAWASRVVDPGPEGREHALGRLLLEIAHQAHMFLTVHGARARTHRRHQLRALLDVHLAHRGEHAHRSLPPRRLMESRHRG